MRCPFGGGQGRSSYRAGDVGWAVSQAAFLRLYPFYPQAFKLLCRLYSLRPPCLFPSCGFFTFDQGIIWVFNSLRRCWGVLQLRRALGSRRLVAIRGAGRRVRIFRLLGRNYLQRALARNHLQVRLEELVLLAVGVVFAVLIAVVLRAGPAVISFSARLFISHERRQSSRS